MIQLDSEGRVPKVPLTSPWLKALNYKLCGIEPTSDSNFACVCTPYVFNMYAGIFGLTGSVGGKAELNYLTKTYSAVKFDVPRFLDTCQGVGGKVVINHGVEILHLFVLVILLHFHHLRHLCHLNHLLTGEPVD